jgi:tetratricopeptide (TPR) repeat protein
MTVEELRKAREEAANVAYMTFTKHIKEDKNGLFCFFEGKDSPYYFSRIKSVYAGNYYPIVCSGKEKVLKVYELIDYHREHDCYKKAFFIDRDFDLPTQNPHIYETPCYGVENFYTSSTTFADILKNEFRLYETDDDFKRCVRKYADLQTAFHAHSTLFNAWYACLIYLRNTTKQLIGAKLEDHFPKEFVTISLNGISGSYDMAAIKTKYPDALEIAPNMLESKIVEMEAQDKAKIFRGKFELHFMLTILDALIWDSKNAKLFVSKPIKYNIDYSQAISHFSQYAETPQDLIAYIEQISN